jgi:TRAP-type mannitol/chloroaromatic compound transport system substrate-binding protein
LRAFPKAIMEACEKASYELYDELMNKSAHWKRIYPAWKKFRDEQFLWFRVAEATYDNYAFFSTVAAKKK